MKLIRGRIPILVALGLLISVFVLSFALSVAFGTDDEPRAYRIEIEGQYSLDGGEWHDTVPGRIIDSPFHTAVVNGRLKAPSYAEDELVIFADNIWFQIILEANACSNGVLGMSEDKPSSPGCDIITCPLNDTSAEEGIACTLELVYPYSMFSNRDLDEFFTLYVTDSSGVYDLMFRQKTLPVLFCVLICFFGLFAFPIAGTVLGHINVRYLSFSLLCFFSGLHLLGDTLYEFMPLWILSPKLCMSVCEMTSHLFGLAALIFITVIFQETKHKYIGNIALIGFSVVLVALIVLNALSVIDLYASKPYAQAVFAVFASVLAVYLYREMKTVRDARLAFFTLIPLAVTLIYDTLNLYFGFSHVMLFEVGVAAAVVYQIVTLIIDLRRQFRETIRYQQMQKELYESRVAIMVSQIQPHFLYNSLTSIAMMCSIDPETAQEATITFADYLRGNMDSLKQKAPVPFDRELEHLKKYLYIEELRFGDDLRIVYDIQTTDFVLPQLSIQPIVENAVKHGVGMKREGGTVTIATRETDAAFEVIVSDDGVGFDPAAALHDGRSHIGMDNVRRRLREMCGGSIEITSEIGRGTVATVRLPKEGQSHEDPLC